MNKHYLMKIGLPSLAFSALFSLNNNIVKAADNSDLEIVPNKIDSITLEDGTKTKVLEFDSKEEADQYKQEHGVLESAETSTEEVNPIPMKATAVKASILPTSYSYVKYNGTQKYKMNVMYSYNGTGKKTPITVTVKRSESSSTSISVGGEFKSVFKAEIGKSYTNNEEWSQTFKVSTPAKKQLEVWSWNIADSYIFSSKPAFKKAIKFNVYRPTSTYGHEVYIYPKRDPR